MRSRPAVICRRCRWHSPSGGSSADQSRRGFPGGGPIWRAAISTAIPIGYALLVTLLARHSETASVLAGRPVDERWELMNQEAAAGGLGLSAIVILAAFILT